jgi:hypothetical protein
MGEAMVGEEVTFALGTRDYRFVARDTVAKQEKGCRNPIFGKDVKDAGSGTGMGTVIEGEVDSRVM